MPFAKRLVEPQLLCRSRVPAEEAPLFEDLPSISSVALSRTLRQLSDLAKHACSIFQELESDVAASSERVRGLQGRISLLQETCSQLDPKQEAVPVSNLDVESKLTTHYQAPWHQQRNLFQPSTRPACVDELHRQTSFSLWALQRDQQRRLAGSREQRVTISISNLPPMPMYPPPQVVHRQEKPGSNSTTFESTRSSSPTECCRLSPWSRKAAPSDLDPDGVALVHRSKFPISNIPSTLDKQTNWTKALPLPTPEERMKCNSQVVTSCVIPINVTGVGFDRDASVRCSLVHSQSVLQRRRKLRRRTTVAGVPRQVQRDLDVDDSPGSRETTLIIHSSTESTPFSIELASHLNTRDSGCQTEDFLISGAPSRRRIRAQRGQGVSLSLSHSAGNITSLPDSVDTMFTASVHLRSRSLPRDTSRMMDNGHNESDDDNEEEELSPFNIENFLPGPMELILKDGEESTDDQAVTAHQLGSLKYQQLSVSPEHSWMERARSHLPRKADMGSCEISSSSDTFSSPVHSVSAAGVLGGQMEHKDDHQSSSGNWSGSSSTCPSQTSETIPPAASPPLTGSSHCDSELSLNAAGHATDDQSGFTLDNYQGLRMQRAGSFSSTAMDILEEVGVDTPVDRDWTYSQPEPPHSQNFSPEAESSLGCPSFTSMATCESSYSDKPPSEKADTVSHYSVDTEGYYTSMHFDCGLKGSRSFTYNYAPCGSDHSLSEFSGHMTLGRRCLSLRKAKAKPSPPSRSSSLRKICSEGNIPDKKEPKITCGQQRPLSKEKRLQLCLSGAPGPMENSSVLSEPRVVWGVESSTDFPDLGLLSFTDAYSFKDEGAVQADYADLWLLNDLKSSDPYRSLSNSSTATGTTVIECMKSQESSESQTSLSGSRATTPSLPSVSGDFKLISPEKLAGLASPSSGYSSQSETPTSSFPSACFPGPLSPAGGKRKPKVPERKSSLSSLSLQSLSCRDVASSKKDLELPIIPPSHLDLSALHSVNDKASAFGTQIKILHQNKQKVLPPAKHFQPSNSEVFNARLSSITPSVLQSVQLRPASKVLEDKHEASPTVNTLPSNQSVELKSPSPYSFYPWRPSKELWDSTFISNKEFTSGGAGCQMELNSQPPSERVTSDGLQLEPSVIPGGAEVSEAGLDREGSEEKPISREDLGSHPEASQQQQPELSEDRACPSPPVLHSPPRWSSVHEVPAVDEESEASRVSGAVYENSNEVENDSSDVLAQSAKHDSEEKTEQYFSQDATPNGSAAPLPHDETRPEDDSVFLSPTKARTTEDLFAMIHRSKRKVLGRKDSSELGVTSRLAAASGNSPPGSAVSSSASPMPPTPSCSPPTPPASSVSPAATPPASQRVSGPIFRNAKKSSISNEEFKLLLLKKGSRSDSSYRMSATEILKSPAAPKSPRDALTEWPPGPEEQPGQEQLSSSPYPKANAEGLLLKASSAASRQGRSRIPPPANSSRYGARGRLFSAPMQAISEGETENSDGSPHDERSPRGST